MNSKIISFSILILVFYNTIFAQNLKTFSGKYDDGTVNKGFATYTYYEDKSTMEYVKHGAFKFTYTDKDDISSQKVSISGNYKNNRRDGLWSCIITFTDWPTNGAGFITGTKTLTTTYLNGKPNGSCMYKYDARIREKRYSALGYTWTPFEPVPSELLTATFREGILTGPIKFINTPPFSDYNSISGQFNQNGEMIGTWIYKSPDQEKSIVFKNGILISFIVRETSSGKIITKEIDNDEMTRIKNDFIAGKITIADLAKNKIKLDTIHAVKKDDYDFSQSFKSADFRFEYIPGDESYYYRPSIYNETTHEYTQESGWVNNRNEGIFYIFNQTPSYKVSDLKEFNSANEYLMNNDFKGAKVDFEGIIYSYEENLSKEDLNLIHAKLKECEKGIEKDRRASKARNLYESIDKTLQWGLDKSALEKLDTLLLKYPDVFTEDELSEIRKKHDKIQTKLNEQEIDSKEWKQIRDNEELIILNHSKILEIYQASGDSYSGYTASKKSHLFSFYNDIYMDFSKQLNSSNNRKARVDLSNLLVAVQNKMIFLIDKDSKDFEKQLKKAEKTMDRANMFL